MTQLETVVLPLERDELYCSTCGTRLLSKGWRSRRIRVLDSNHKLKELTVMYQRATCPNRSCTASSKSVVPKKLKSLLPDKSPYSSDVMQAVVELRNSGNKTFKDIQRATGIPRSSIHSIYHRGIRLFTAISESLPASSGLPGNLDIICMPEATVAVLNPNATSEDMGQTVMLDATSEKMSRLKVFIVADAITGEVLLSATLHNTTAHTYDVVLDVLNERYNVRHVTADMEAGLKKAVHESMPHVTYQYCHFHFLKNAGTKLLTEDYERLQRYRSEIQRQIEMMIETLVGACIHLRSKECETLSKMLYILRARPRSTSGSGSMWGDRAPPFYLVDLKRSKNLLALVDMILGSVTEKNKLLSELKLMILRSMPKIQRLRELVRLIMQKYEGFKEIRKMLASGDADTHTKISSYLKDKPYLRTLRDYFEKYDSYLWHYLENPQIPRTIAGLERFFGQLKRSIRGLNSIPGVTLDGSGLLLPFLIGRSVSSKSRWSQVLLGNEGIIDRYKMLKQVYLRKREERRIQIEYDVALSEDEGRKRVFRELAVEIERVALTVVR